METLSNDLLSLAEALTSGAYTKPKTRLKEALEDYTNVCEHLNDEGLSAIERNHWLEIRSELVNEVTRLILRIKQFDSTDQESS